MKRYFFTLIILVITTTSCTEEFENNARLGFEINVVDENNQPLENIEVSLFFSDGNSNSDGIIAQNITDSNGFVNLISLSPGEDNDGLSLTINSNFINSNSIFFMESNTIDENFGGVRYDFFQGSLESNTIEIPITTLQRTAILNFEIVNTSGSSNSINFVLTYESRNQVFNLTNGNNFIVSDFSNNLDPSELPFLTEIPTLLNSIANFSYQIRDVDGNVIETESTEIIIDQELTNYVFEY